jgi:hypothetical protein
MIGYYFIQNKYKYVGECEMTGIDKATRKIESLETEENENLLHNNKNKHNHNHKGLQEVANISIIYKKILNYIF